MKAQFRFCRRILSRIANFSHKQTYRLSAGNRLPGGGMKNLGNTSWHFRLRAWPRCCSLHGRRDPVVRNRSDHRTVTDSSGGSLCECDRNGHQYRNQPATHYDDRTRWHLQVCFAAAGQLSGAVQCQGFRDHRGPGGHNRGYRTATVNRVLAVGTVTESVTVQAAAEALQTESSTLGGTVTGRSIANFPPPAVTTPKFSASRLEPPAPQKTPPVLARAPRTFQ